MQIDPHSEGKNSNPVIRKKRTDGNWVDLVGTTLSAIIISLILWYYIFHKDETLILLALLGTVSGWACGLIASPYNDGEVKSMGSISKIASVIIGGYVVAKLDGILDAIISSATKQDSPLNDKTYNLAIHLAACLVMFMTAFIFVYITRTYNFGLSRAWKKLKIKLQRCGLWPVRRSARKNIT